MRICKVCGQKIKLKGFASHIKTHGMNYETYYFEHERPLLMEGQDFFSGEPLTKPLIMDHRKIRHFDSKKTARLYSLIKDYDAFTVPDPLAEYLKEFNSRWGMNPTLCSLFFSRQLREKYVIKPLTFRLVDEQFEGRLFLPEENVYIEKRPQVFTADFHLSFYVMKNTSRFIWVESNPDPELVIEAINSPPSELPVDQQGELGEYLRKHPLMGKIVEGKYDQVPSDSERP